MSSIFISYRRKGGSIGSILGQLLYYRLKEDGHEVFFDTESMKAGRFDEQIIDQINASDIFLLLLTAHALDRCGEEGDFVRLEISHAMKQNKKIILIMTEDFKPPKTLPEEIGTIMLYQGVKVNLELAEAFYQRVLEYINGVEAADKDSQYDLYEQTIQRFKELFPKYEKHTTENPDVEEETAEPIGDPEEDDYPEDKLGYRCFSVYDANESTTLCFQIRKTVNPNGPDLHYLILLPVESEPVGNGIRRTYYPVFETGRIKDTLIELVFLTIKPAEHEVYMNAGDYRNGILRIGIKPGIIRYGQDKEQLPAGWVQESLLDMSGFEDSPDEKVREFISPYSPEKLEYVFVDPYTQQVVRPKIVRGKDGKLYLKVTMLTHHSYITLQASK